MRISEAFFRQLLDNPQAHSAAFALERHWCAREGFTLAAPAAGLSEPEYAAHLCIAYMGEVVNGGHEQFFLNPGGRLAAETLAALERTGLSGVERILRQACSVFCGGVVPARQDERERAIKAMSSAQFQEWSRLDNDFYQNDTEAWIALRDYLRAHEHQVLSPERGLAAA